ncbi:transcriptional regulator, GntR family [Roseibium hamelinense]|uniref:Transcriptional regulator, GntR family n=1 Tax=Roseibium hamelinense TaxID=150831 RepID=A0A562T381_9HYPH|nr:GntR family transcriptional regulator [Roseibium hamelinense]MTI44420.1 GntR family transcriptional regulator [Roseibium hamelinense]TWI87386.1 transcriptional regulator, GntR family [Roseibium hamelinense]
MPPTRGSAKNDAYEAMKRAILTLERKPGSSLEESELCTAFGLSRTPLREVLQQLAGEGYVVLQANRGARVSDMTHYTLRDFFLAAPLVYSAIMRLAAQNATQAQISDLKWAQEAFRSALEGGSVTDRALTNDRFHRITGEMADNPYLMVSLDRLLIDHTRIAMTFFRPNTKSDPERLSQASRQHDDMIAAIEAGDEDRAASLALEHWALSRDQIELFVMPRGLEAPLGQLPTQKSA